MATRRYRKRKINGYTRNLPIIRKQRKLMPIRYGGWVNPMTAEKKSLTKSSFIDGVGSNIVLLNGSQMGSGIENRIGTKINIESVYIKLYFQVVANDDAPQLARVILVQDRQTNGAAPVIGDLVDNEYPTSHLNMENRSRFKILIDKVIKVNKSIDGKADYTFWKKFRKVRIKTGYNSGNTGNVDDIATNGLFLVLMNCMGGVNSYNCRYAVRTKFTDY